MNPEELREKIAETVYQWNPPETCTLKESDAAGFNNTDVWQLADDILSIEIGGEVVEMCIRCRGTRFIYEEGESETVVETGICPDCIDGTTTRPRLLRDCVKEER